MVRMKSSGATLFVAVIVLLGGGRVLAQTPAQASAQAAPQGGQGMQQPVPPQLMDLATAKKMAATVEAAAAAQNQFVAVTIMDARGDTVLLERMDSAGILPVSTSQGKARAVVAFGIPTGEIADDMHSGKPVPMIKAPLAGSGDMTFMRGGLPIMKGGKMVGAIAVGGSASETDEKFAQAGIDAVMPK